MQRKPLSNKIIVLGIDGLDPKLTKKYMEMGKMPHVKKIMERGSAREDLVLLGANPTITPPLWTTMATGAYPMTHGITCFFRQSEEHLDTIAYNLDSTNCKAELLWNVFAEAGKKTLVWHWPGSAWPPTSDNPNLHVVDGSSPGAVNMSSGQLESELVLVASKEVQNPSFKEKAAADSNIPCVITGMDEIEEEQAAGLSLIFGDGIKMIYLGLEEGQAGTSETPIDFVFSPIKPASGWFDAPEDALEFTLLLSRGLVRRVGLILKGTSGNYENVALFKHKKDLKPYVTFTGNEYQRDIFDDSIKHDKKYLANRDMRLIELAPDGSKLKLWVSAAMNTEADTMWHPKSLYQEVVANVGYPTPTAMLGGGDKKLISDCMLQCWYHAADWQGAALNYLMEKGNYEMIFSHFHNVDLEDHMFIKYLKNGHGDLSSTDYQQFLEDLYVQTDYYFGKFVHFLDEGWTIVIVSDHAQLCPEHGARAMGDTGVNIRVMAELGYTTVVKDAAGNETHEIDWSKTKAVAARGNHIYINLKGRNEYGIVEPTDQYELEEQLISDLYSYRDPLTQKRTIALAVRRRDAVLFGLGGPYPQCGDIIYFKAEGYTFDHGDGLSTALGACDTSLGPIFLAAGQGIKEGYTTERYIRQVDIAPTLAVLGGVRMPKECEGAVAYQILTEDY